LDLFVANGNPHHEYTEEDVLLLNDGTGVFKDVSRDSGDYFQMKKVGRGSTFADYDNDGDLDLLIVNLNDEAKLLRNDGGNRNNWLSVSPRFTDPLTDAIGARVTVQIGPLRQIEDIIPVRGYLSQVDPRAHFGCGRAELVDSVEIRWPDGKIQTMTNVKVNQFLEVARKPE
jgi:hypothetical protein